jgi:hypothetical protein
MSKRFSLSRRAVLRGAGVALGLPFLEAMLDKVPARADGLEAPKRFIVVGGATSTGSDRGIFSTLDASALRGMTIPVENGMNYTMPLGLLPLQAARDHVTIVSGLRMLPGEPGAPLSDGIGHDANMLAQLTGTTVDGMVVTSLTPRAPTCDQLMLPLLRGTSLYPALHLRAQVVPSFERGTKFMSQRRVGNRIQAELPRTSPEEVFRALFSTLPPPTPEGREAERKRRELDLHVVDSVYDRARKLESRLGQADRRRLDQHLTEVSELEKRIRTLPVVSASCRAPDAPGPDPQPTPDGTYAGETERARAMVDLLHMALLCDLTRVATLQLSVPEWELAMAAATGDPGMNISDASGSGLHLSIHHSGNTNTMRPHEREAKALAWHVDHFTRLVRLLAASPEANGGTMLDSSAVLYVSEGGWGPGGFGSHAPENMLMLLAGRAGGLRPAGHMHVQTHPGRVIFGAMKALGYAEPTFGEITSELPGLRGA